MGSDLKTAGISMVRLGEALKDAREKKSVTIDQVQKQTRIHSAVLKALEEGRCDSILTPTYVKSFLKKYAEYLGLDARQLLAEYSKLHPASSAQKSSLCLTGKTDVSAPVDFSKYFPVIKRVAIPVIVIALAIFIGSKAINGLKHRPGPRPEPMANIARSASAPSKKKGPSPVPVTSKKESAPKEQAIAKASTAASPIPKTTPLKLIVSVKQTVLVKVRTDGDLLFSRVLTRGSVESFTAKERFNVYVAKGEAVELFLNGRSLGSPGKGPVKDMEITRSGLKIK